ncbi:MAG TPA: hypothetical protein VE153_21365 [Myxococcus sp.]|nr:hypothetical protein [Myxococcus sp.]
MPQRIIGCICLGLTVLFGCAGPDEELVSDSDSRQQEIPRGPVKVTLLTGEVVEVDASKICWDTLTPIPEGAQVVPDAKANRLRFVPQNADTRSGSVVEPIADEGGDGITCTCNSGGGGCSPAKIGGNVGCVMSSCSNCSKS